jgi:hypothetical protein
MNIFVIILLILVIVVIFLCVDVKNTEKIYKLFRKGVILRHYEVTGNAFKRETLLTEEVVLDRKGKYVLLQCNGNEREDNINLIINYSDKVELIWDGKVIATFGNNC